MEQSRSRPPGAHCGPTAQDAPPGGASEQRPSDGVVVVIPAHNEESLLAGAVEAVLVAGAHSAAPMELVVVLDLCTDGSGKSLPPEVRLIRATFGNVGSARAWGFHEARGAEGQSRWFATTDADSRVPANWLQRHLDHMARGEDMVAGTVRLGADPDGDPELRLQWEGDYQAPDGPRHVHGANLGFREDVYWRVGGFRALASGEDVDLVRRFEAAGARIAWAEDIPVTTSGRLDGRAPKGFSDHLLRLARAGELDDAS